MTGQVSRLSVALFSMRQPTRTITAGWRRSIAASGSGVARQWPTDDPLPVRALFAAAADGDPAARAVKARLAEGIASAVRVLVLTVDVDAVVIGGGLSHLGERLLGDVHEVLERWARSSPFLASLELPGRVRLVPEGPPVAALGAALVGESNG